MKSWNVSFDGEQKQRHLVKELLGPNLSSESVPFTFSVDHREEICRAPMAFVPDLVAKITQLLDQNDR
jgi:hypothetical protein